MISTDLLRIASPVVQCPETGRWYITMGYCGFNTRANNGSGYATEKGALRVIARLEGKRPAQAITLARCTACGNEYYREPSTASFGCSDCGKRGYETVIRLVAPKGRAS